MSREISSGVLVSDGCAEGFGDLRWKLTNKSQVFSELRVLQNVVLSGVLSGCTPLTPVNSQLSRCEHQLLAFHVLMMAAIIGTVGLEKP